MKVYEWTFKDKTGIINAANSKDAKTMLAGILRDKGDTSTRVPKGTKLKKIGLTKGSASIVAAKVEEPKAPEKPAKCTQIPDFVFEKADKDTKLSNCCVQTKAGVKYYASNNCDLIIPKGTEFCVTVKWH